MGLGQDTLETDRLEVPRSAQVHRGSSNQLCVAPLDLHRYGSSLDVTSSYHDINFSLSEETTVSSVWPQIAACSAAASFHFAAGAVLGFSAILIPQLQSPDSDIKVTKEDISWIASVVALVAPVGAIVTGYLVDKIGRVKTILTAAVPFLVGWVCIALAQNIPMLLFGRTLTGLSVAMGTSPGVVYITEIARADLRGALICMAPSMVSFGMVIMYTKGAFLQWRLVAWLSGAYCLLPLLFLTLWAPETPVWLVSKGRTQDALKSLTYLLRRDKKAGIAEQQLAELVKEHNSRMERPDQQGSSFGNLLRGLTKSTGFKPLLILTTIFGFQQFSGIYITIFYAVSFFKDVGADIDPYLSSVGVGLVRLIIGIITTFLLKSFGRRPLFLISGLGMAAFVFVSGYITKEVAEGVREPTFIPVICILMYMSLGVIGLLSIPWTMTAELFAIEIRGMAQGLIISLAHILMFLALKMYPFLSDMLGGAYAVQWLFAGVSLGAVVFIFIFLPETHKKTLAEIQEYFKNNTIYICSKENRKEVDNNEEEIGEEMIKLKNNV